MGPCGKMTKNVEDVRNILTFVEEPSMFEMARTVTVSLGQHYEEFIRQNIAGGRYNNASEVVRAALRRLEEDETRLAAMRAALIEGEESGIVEDFDPKAFVDRLNAAYDAEVQAI